MCAPAPAAAAGLVAWAPVAAAGHPPRALALGATASACGSSGGTTAPPRHGRRARPHGHALGRRSARGGGGAGWPADARRGQARRRTGRGAHGGLAVRVRVSDDADPATGRSDPIRCLAGASRAVADPTSVALIGTYESACTLTALTAARTGRASRWCRREHARLRSSTRARPGAACWCGSRRRTRCRAPPRRTRRSRSGCTACSCWRALGEHRRAARGALGGGPRRRRRDRRQRADADDARGRNGPARPLPRGARRCDLVRRRAGARRGGPAARDRGRGSAPACARPAGRDRDRRALPRRPGARRGRRLREPARDLAVRAARLARRCGRRLRRRVRRPLRRGRAVRRYAADAARLVLATLRRSNGTRAGVLRALYAPVPTTA